MKILTSVMILLSCWSMAAAADETAPAPAAATASAPASQPTGDELFDEQIDQRIQSLRTGEITLSVLDASGKPLADTEVIVCQTRHQFLFGCNVYGLSQQKTPALNEAYANQFADLFNYATLPFYWGSYEHAEGTLGQDRLMAMATWCHEQGIRPKGHPLLWHLSTPLWLQGKTPQEVEALQWGRITREVSTFAGHIDTWDVVNEATDMPGQDKDKPNAIVSLCKRLGQVEMIRQAFATARSANPKATLILNDYETGGDYEKLIQQCLDKGTSIDAVGVQSHMHHGPLTGAKVWDICQRFGRFGKPLHWTEMTVLSGDRMKDDDYETTRTDWNSTSEAEARQAERVVKFYRILFSHPAVQAITWWDLSDQGAWLGAPAGLLHKDMTPKPAYEALHKLIKDTWWTGPLTRKTDGQGNVTFRGYLGDYKIRAERVKGTFSITAGQTAGQVKLE